MSGRRLVASLFTATIAVAGVVLSPRLVARAAGQPPVGHVWVVVLENENYDTTFNHNPNSYLPALKRYGAFIPSYYGIGHASLDNYVALLGGQSPNGETEADCQAGYHDVQPGTAPPQNPDGQVVGQGCVYPASRPTLADQLSSVGKRWKGYMEDFQNDPKHELTPCSDPAQPQQDPSQSAEAADQYAQRHDPFMYYASVIATHHADCSADVVKLQDPAVGLAHDLQSVATTPDFSFVTPNLCDDGHDATCTGPNLCKAPADPHAGGLTAIDCWLAEYVPIITQSPAYRQDGMLVVTFDESASDNTACCGEPAGPNTNAPGGGQTNQNVAQGAGGGQVGALVLSPFINPGTVSTASYNHYSLLRTVEDLFGTSRAPASLRDDTGGHLGYAGTYADYVGPGSFGSDVFTNPAYGSAPTALPPVPLPPPNEAVSLPPPQPVAAPSPSPSPTAAASASPSSTAATGPASLLTGTPPAQPGGLSLVVFLLLLPLLSLGGVVGAVIIRRQNH